jgi:uncharacterized membrane protein YuzA (DUF378 family)
LTFLGAGLWATFGIGAFDVVVTDAGGTEPMEMLVYTGVGIAILVALYGFYDLLTGAGAEVSEQNVRDVFR